MLEFVDRRGSNSYKWDSDEAKDNLPLWVADMDFKAAPEIRAAMQRRLEHGVFGYSIVPEEYYNAVSGWFCSKHGWKTMYTNCMIPTIGIVPAISAVLKALSMQGRSAETETAKIRVLTLTPAYNCFFSCINNMEAELVESRLINYAGQFRVNWDDFQSKAAESDVFLFCNPHNPTGRVWTEKEIGRIADICENNNVFVIADEIHCEFTMPEHKYIPYATIAKRTDKYCILTSASKAFNIAGLQCANIYVPERTNYDAVNRAVNIHEVCDLNPFGVVATIAAYNEGENWLKELNEQVYENYALLCEAIIKMPMLSLTKMEGTYLAWVNIERTGLNSEDFCKQLEERQAVKFSAGKIYGDNNYIRINLATSEEILRQAIARLQQFVNNHICL